nr:DUF6543 domain-containing protein [uncultured Pseudomonas sp.]
MPTDSIPTNNRPPSTYSLLTQLSTGPSIREVAANLLRAALKEQYPTLNIDPDLATVVTPHWRIVDDLIQSTPPAMESLTSVLANQALSPEPVIYIDGEHFLTAQPEAPRAEHLPVKIDDIARLINELAALIFTAYQEQQLDYWNASSGLTGPRWQLLSHSLRNVWNVTTQEGWDEHDCAMARLLYRFPEQAKRKAVDTYQVHAYLIDMDTSLNNQSTHIGLSDMAVLIGKHEQSERILAYSLLKGYEKFESLEKLGESLPASLAQYQPGEGVQWRLYEPGADFFDSLACNLIALQLQAIGSIGPTGLDVAPVTVTTSQAVVRILPVIEDLSEHSLSSIRQIHEQLPDWLANASDLDVSTYSRYVIELAEVHTHNLGRTFQDDVPPIRDYAREQLHKQINWHRNRANLNLDKVEISIESPVVWGTFVLPGTSDITRRSLIDLALENLTGLPTGTPSVHYNGGKGPAWLTYDYLKGVIETLDIGGRYPKLIKKILLDDPQQSRSRQTLYTSHLRTQLPLLALQWKIQGLHGIDERGYRYVAAAVQTQAHERQVDGQEIVIRRLAFIPILRPGKEQDGVENMFVIGPHDHTQGPCLLYRPLLEPVLLQFPSRQNLLYAIKHNHSLRDSVLAWLPNDSRFNYEQYVFPAALPSPWTVVRGLVEPQVLVQMSGPIALSDEVLGNDPLATLFKDNANAMVELANRQSVSNVKKRWATYRQAGWLIFSAALPFLGRTVGIAAWIWQIMDDLQEATQAEPGPDGKTSWTAQVDLLLNLGMALVLHVALRHPPQPRPLKARPPRIEPTQAQPPASAHPTPLPQKIPVTKQPNLPDAELPARHLGPLHNSGAVNRLPSSLAATLDRFKVDKPDGLGEPVKEPGIHLHLYALGDKWYAPVKERWFEVMLDENDTVMIIDPQRPSHVGPMLISNLAGQWYVDTRLRLRGAGFRNRRKAARAQKPSRIVELRDQLTTFNAGQKRGQAEVATAHAAIEPQPGPSANLQRRAFIEKLDTRLAEYDVPIRQLRALNVIDTVPNYQCDMIDYLNQQLLLTRFAVSETLPTFRTELLSTLDEMEALAPMQTVRQTALAEKMSQLNLDMISRLEYAQTRYLHLQELGIDGLKVIQNTLHALPDFKLHDLKALQITLNRYLCIKEGSGEAFVDAHTQLNEIVNIADLNIQTWIEAMPDASVSDPSERIEVLNSLVEQFSLVDQRLLDLHAEHPDYVQREPLESLRQRIDDFNRQAVHELARLLKERKPREPKAGPSKTPQVPKKKVIKTRFNAVVVGEPRPSDEGLLDVKAPVTGKVIATFHEKSPGVWVERITPASRPQRPPAADLDTSMSTAQNLLDEEPSTTQRLLAQSRKAGRIPVEIEEMLHQHAARMGQAASSIEEALTQRNLTESDRPSAAALNRQLNHAMQRLYALGTSTRVSMTKQQRPTAARVQWLHSQGAVKIAKVITRRRLKGPGKDYLDEYAISDHDTQEVLWYAHFHYDSPPAELDQFTAGHLKTRDQQRLGGAIHRTGLSDGDQIAIYRSEISPQLARSLFFQS